MRPLRSLTTKALGIALGFAALLASVAATAQTYPTKPILVISPYAGGGGADAVVRLVTQYAGTLLGQQFVIEPRSGAGGNIAAEAVVKSPADGYSLLFATPLLAINASLYRKLNYDPQKNLTITAVSVTGPYVMYATGNLPMKNAADFIVQAKANPGRLNYGSLGVGTGPHLGLALFASMAGIEITHVPYRGFGQILPDLVSGQVHLALNAIGVADGFVQQGKVKMLGFTSAKRLPGFPDVPAIAETVPGFEVGGWYGFAAPAGTPPAIVERLNADFVRAVNMPEVSERILKMGLFPESWNRADSAKYFAREVDKWGRAVKAAGAKVDE